MKNRYRILLSVALLLAAVTMDIFGQQMYIPDHAFEDFNITTDRDLYVSGESIWFATHCSGKENTENSPLSSIMYVELFDADEKVIRRGKFEFNMGCSSGQLSIPSEQPSGVYFIRAYSHYLKNFHPATFPTKIITIINPSIPLSKNRESTNDPLQYTVRGGKLISRLEAQVAIRIPRELVPDISRIELLSQDTIIVPQISLFENGLGYVKFTPVESEHYYFQLHLTNGDSVLTALPEVEKSGYTMRFKEEGKDIVYFMNRNQKDPFTSNKKYILKISSCKFATLLHDSLSAVSPVTEFRIKKEALPPGINYFILRNEQGDILDLAMYYKNPPETPEIAIVMEKGNFRPGEQATIGFHLPPDFEENIATVSVAVIKKGTMSTIQDKLPTWLVDQPLLIQPELFKEQPMREELLTQINLSLMFYEEVVTKSQELIRELENSRILLQAIPETRNVSISGYVKNNKTSDPVSGSKVLLSYINTHSQIHINETQEDGYFIFPVEPYGPDQDLFLCTFNENPDQEILINSDYSTRFARMNTIYPEIDTSDRKLIEEMFINQQLLDLRKNDFPLQLQPKDDYELGFGVPDISIRLEDYIDLPTMQVVLNEIVPYVKVRKKKGNYRLTILDSETGLSYENHLIMVDNIPVDNLNELMQIHPASVEKVDVINRTYVIGDYSFQGILMVTTFTENFGGISMPMDAVFLKYPLISDEYVFPDYEEEPMPGQQIKKANFRNVLFWEPGIQINSQSEISFYTSDHLSKYDIIIQGMTPSGKAVYGKKEIVVSK